MKKCILLIRVSTLSQDYVEQENVVRNAAMKDGFTADNIISIADKESAIKLSEEERHGLNELKRNIESDPDITCVYCFALDRISRKKKILFSIIDYLVERKIQLIILAPNRVELLNKDNSINEMAEMFISIFSVICESEMREKKARFMCAKAANKRYGRYNGGEKPLGWILNSDGTFSPDPNNFIVDIFNLYRTGDYSHQDIAKEMKARGHFQNLSVYCTTKRITSILNDKRYYGDESRHGVRLEPLITKELFDECRAVGEKKRFIRGVNVKKLNDKSRMLKGIIYHDECGHTMVGNLSIDRYICVSCNFSLKKSLVDSAVWFIVSPLYSSYLVGKQHEDTTAIDGEISSMYSKISVAEKDIKTMLAKVDKINQRIIDMFLNEKRGNEMILQVNTKIKELQKQITEYRNRISELEILKSTRKSTVNMHNVDDIYNITDPAIRYDICHEIIERITVSKEMRRMYTLNIKIKTGQELSFRLNTQTGKMETDPGEWVKV